MSQLKFRFMYYDLNTIDLSCKRVRCNGRSLDKCALSGLIREVNIKAGITYITWSDIYWDSAKYSELKNCLLDSLKKIGLVINV